MPSSTLIYTLYKTADLEARVSGKAEGDMSLFFLRWDVTSIPSGDGHVSEKHSGNPQCSLLEILPFQACKLLYFTSSKCPGKSLAQSQWRAMKFSPVNYRIWLLAASKWIWGWALEMAILIWILELVTYCNEKIMCFRQSQPQCHFESKPSIWIGFFFFSLLAYFWLIISIRVKHV